MGTIGAERLLTDYGSSLQVAEALLEGKLSSYEQRYVPEVVSKTDLEAARIRIERRQSTITVDELVHALDEELRKNTDHKHTRARDLNDYARALSRHVGKVIK